MLDRIFRGRGGGQGRGQGPGQGRGIGRGAGNKPGSGPGGMCVCPSCGEKIAHQIGQPCMDLTCPKCGTRMVKG
jgi:hypothetical protein